MGADVARAADSAAAAPNREPASPTSAWLPLDDPRVVQMLTAEHASQTTARSLAYNEAFTRLDMFLGFLSTSIVALALIAQVVPVNEGLLPVTAVILTFDLVVGFMTLGRIPSANYEDYRAIHGMTRIRNAYHQIAPAMLPYLTTGIHDDEVMANYGDPPQTGLGGLVYGMTTSAGMLMTILAMLTAVLAFVVAAIVGAPAVLGLIAAVVAAVALFGALIPPIYSYVTRRYEMIPILFPTPRSQRQGDEPPQNRGQ